MPFYAFLDSNVALTLLQRVFKSKINENYLLSTGNHSTYLRPYPQNVSTLSISLKIVSLILTFNHVNWKSIGTIHSPARATLVPNIAVKSLKHTKLALDRQTDRLTKKNIPSFYPKRDVSISVWYISLS